MHCRPFSKLSLASLKAFVANTPHCTAGILAYNGATTVQLGDRLWAIPLFLLLSQTASSSHLLHCLNGFRHTDFPIPVDIGFGHVRSKYSTKWNVQVVSAARSQCGLFTRPTCPLSPACNSVPLSRLAHGPVLYELIFNPLDQTLDAPDLDPSNIVPGLWLDLCWDALCSFPERGSRLHQCPAPCSLAGDDFWQWRMEFCMGRKEPLPARVIYSECVNLFDRPGRLS